MKNIAFFLLILILGGIFWNSKYISISNKSELYKGERNLSYKQRITAEGRYDKLARKIKCIESKDEIVNQLLYIKNGYYDYGYVPGHDKHCGARKIPDGFWVYVYPYWFIWKNQKLF